MRCKKCNSLVLNGCCVRCGLLENGNHIGNNKKKSKFDEIRIYNDSFDEMYRNVNSFSCFILGPLYFSYRNHLISGFFIGLFDFFITLYYELWLGAFFKGYFSEVLWFLIILFIFIKRLLYSMFSNYFCLKLDFLNMKTLKKNNNNYKLSNHKSKSIIKFIINILIYVVILLVFVLYKRIKNGTISF